MFYNCLSILILIVTITPKLSFLHVVTMTIYNKVMRNTATTMLLWYIAFYHKKSTKINKKSSEAVLLMYFIVCCIVFALF